MATDTATKNGAQTPPVEEEWEDIKIGLGREWDLEHDGPMTGTLIGMEVIPVEDKQNGGMRDATAYAFQVENPTDGNPNRFIWGSHNIDLALREIPAGARLRITFTGIDSFTGEKGPQQIKTYRIQRAKTA